MRRIDRSPRNDVTQLKKLDGDNNRGVDRASDNQVGRKRKAAEPNAQRARQDEQRNACDRNTEKETINDTCCDRGRRCEALGRNKSNASDCAGNSDDGQQSQFSLKPCVHARPSVAVGSDYTRINSAAFMNSTISVAKKMP